MERSDNGDERFKFTGKEQDAETDFNYFGARYYDAGVRVWLSVDPLADKYPNLSSYCYTANNPIVFIDPDGRKLKVANKRTFELLLSTLPPDGRKYIKLNRKGYVKKRLVKKAMKHCENSKNLQALNTIVRDKRVVSIDATNESYNYINPSNEQQSSYNFAAPTRENMYQVLMSSFEGTEEEKAAYGEQLKAMRIKDEVNVSGNFGVALRPSDEQDPYPGGQISTSNNLEVYVNPVGTTDVEQAENIGHELYGHIYFYLIGKDPRHGGASGKLDGNLELENFIDDRENESRHNQSR